jgi:hypothetical protein
MEFKILKKLQEKKLKLDGLTYKPYTVGNLPPSFGFKAEDDKEGTYRWFNYKGLTYIKA